MHSRMEAASAGHPSWRRPTAETMELTDAEIKERMSGNLCRCGAYVGIVEAIHEAFDGEVTR